MSGLTLPPSVPCLVTVEASPLPLRSLAGLQTLATTATAKSSPAADKPITTSHPEMKPASRGPLAAFQEHISVLRQNLVGAEHTLDTVKPEDFGELRKALLQVSKMISQMESVAEALKDKRRDLRNDLRTLEEENALLHEALFRERCKALTKPRSSATLRFDRKIVPPTASPAAPVPPPPGGVVYTSMRQLLFAPTITRYWAGDDNDSPMDFMFDDVARSASASRIASNLATLPSLSARKGRGIIASPLSPYNTAGNAGAAANQPATARRGRGLAGRPRPRPIVRPLTANDSIASLTFGPPPSLSGYHLLLRGTAPTISAAPFTPDSLTGTGQNEIEDLANKLSNRNNRLAGLKTFSVVEWCPGLD